MTQVSGEHPGHSIEDELPKDLPRVGTRTIAIAALAGLVLLAALFVAGYIPHRNRIAEARKVADEQNAKPIVDVIQPRRVASSGDLVLPADARAFQETSIYPRANGYLKRLLVDIGDRVTQGQLMAEIDTPEVDAQLNEARAAAEQARANLTKSKADLALAESTLKRFEEAEKSGTGAVTAQDLDEKRAALNQAKSASDAAAANVTAADAAVQRLLTLQSFEKVTAPFSGIVSARNYDVGALLMPANSGSAGHELFRLTQADTLRVFVNVPQTYATVVKVGQPAKFEVRNFPGRTFDGKVVRSAGAIDPSTRTLRTEIDIPNPDYVLSAGMYGQVKMAVQADQPPLLVPTSAMLFQSDGTKVALVDGGKIRMRKISVGRDLGQELEVTQGLSGDESVVTNPGERLADGVEVQVAQIKAGTNQSAPNGKTQTAAR